ncbi:hypothetical protein SLA2020_098160 [Shorea laevis]
MAAKSYQTARTPSHYLLKIENVSKLIAACVDETNESGMYESAFFEAGGYNWSLVIYPNGDARKRTQGFLSLYLKIDIAGSTRASPAELNVEADVQFFVFDQIRRRYTVYYEEGGWPGFKRFNSVEPMWGIDKVMDNTMLQQEQNGYTVKNACIIGVEIIISSAYKAETLKMVDIEKDRFLKWNIPNYLKTGDEVIDSSVKNVEGWEWKMELYPKGKGNIGHLGTQGSFASLYLTLVNAGLLRNNQKVYADFELQILNKQAPHNDVKKQVKRWFSAQERTFGVDRMIETGKLCQWIDGFVMHDGALNLQAEIKLVSVVQSGLNN